MAETASPRKETAPTLFRKFGPLLFIFLFFLWIASEQEIQELQQPINKEMWQPRALDTNLSSTHGIIPSIPMNISKEPSYIFSNLSLLISPSTINRSNSPLPNSKLCGSPTQKIVYIKTHKTGSTSLASILERYGYTRNLTFAVGRSHILSYSKVFNRKNLLSFANLKPQIYDFLTNHARYNRKEMNDVVPDATYITILRHPVSQLESAFGYYEMYKGMKLINDKEAFEKFMQSPSSYFGKQNYNMWRASRNGLLFDLGFDHKYDDDSEKIKDYIKVLDRDFDLVLITEYFDESLILLKRHMCWTFQDILYIKQGVRSSSHHYNLSPQTAEKVMQWSKGDLLLYEHFNSTFWRKINTIGSVFWEELREFQSLLNKYFEKCINQNKKDKKDRRVEKYILKDKEDEICLELIRGDMQWTPLIRKSMIMRFGDEKQKAGLIPTKPIS